MSDQAASWVLEGRIAHLNCGFLQGYAACIAEGVSFIAEKWKGRSLERTCVLTTGGPRQGTDLLDFSELYIRGSDFVANCVYLGTQRIAPQVYWRASEDRASSSARIELVLSVNTELLDSTPELEILSLVPDAMLFHCSGLNSAHFQEIQTNRSFDRAVSAEQLFVLRSASLGLMYAQMVHPSDFVSAKISFDGTRPLFLETILFPERLEKGVIRRGRICGWFMPAENDLETAVELARQFVDEPLPLTT